MIVKIITIVGIVCLGIAIVSAIIALLAGTLMLAYTVYDLIWGDWT